MTIRGYYLRRKRDCHWLTDGCMGLYWAPGAIHAERMPWIEQQGPPYKHRSHPGSLVDIMVRVVSENEAIEVMDADTEKCVMTIEPTWFTRLRLWMTGWDKFALATAAKERKANRS